ncbi:uncharacterized protein ACHE_30824A [Aspergillus chevalieri]|uniref:Uncharacterized protein n=1 Tax=Aspergillus chevalieri TaxID=182096 RepID=A0A7R7ZN31_ASPCH|nr:uncharacterized protein ACHE_30824A [Aspergillus chevalieri]BCR86837.1 hypothetical protein ACHE_30824A [Aspergillus chevalieri]
MTEQSQAQTLLLIFRKESPDLFHLLNETGLPISATSPLIKSQTQGKTLVVAPLLLVAVTEAMRANQDVFGGFEYLMSWTANDFRHFYVVLEKRPPPKAKSDDNNNGSSSSPWGDKPEDQKSNAGGWGDNDNNNDTDNSNSNDQNGNSNSAWGDNNNSSSSTNNNNSGGNDAWGAPPSSPVRDNNSNNNAASEFANHAWPADLVSANNPNGNGNRNRGGRGRTASGASDWDVRDWARSPSEVGGAGASAGGGGGWGGGTPATTAPGSSRGKSEW